MAAQSDGVVLGYSVSSQFAGQVIGPLLGGFVGGHVGMGAVFLGTSALLLLCALYNWRSVGLSRRPAPVAAPAP